MSATATRHAPVQARSRPDTMRTPGDPRNVVMLDPGKPLPVRLTLPPERPDDEAQDAGDTAERVVPIAGRLVSLVHDEGHVYEITALLRALRGAELEALAVTLAAMVDPDRTPRELLEWVTWDEHGRPLGEAPVMPVLCAAPSPNTHAGYQWHATREGNAAAHACLGCDTAEKTYQRERCRQRRVVRG